MFLSSMLLANGMYSSNQIFAFENQTVTENEAEVKADIEQENKCKQDTECENKNKINNKLNIITSNASSTGTGGNNGNGDGDGNGQEDNCLFCFSNQEGAPFSQGQISQLDSYLGNPTHIVPIGADSDVDSIEELCQAIVEASQTQTKVTSEQIANLLNAAIQPDDANLINAVIECLGDLIVVVT